MTTGTVLFRLLLDVAVIIHFSFALFAVFGALTALWRFKIIWIHIPAVLWAALIEFSGWYCPLTPLEEWLREKSITGYGYIEIYIMPILYPEHLTRPIQFILGFGVLIVNGAAYWLIIRRRIRRTTSRD